MAKHKSILTGDMTACMVCQKPHPEVHHVIYGNSNRKWSDKYGLIVPLCAEHHRGSDLSPHFNKDFDLELKKVCTREISRGIPGVRFYEYFWQKLSVERMKYEF